MPCQAIEGRRRRRRESSLYQDGERSILPIEVQIMQRQTETRALQVRLFRRGGGSRFAEITSLMLHIMKIVFFTFIQ